MSTFEHNQLVKNINDNLTAYRKSQPEVMQAFGQLARSTMAERSISSKHKEGGLKSEVAKVLNQHFF